MNQTEIKPEVKQGFFSSRWALIIATIGNVIGIISPRLFEEIKIQDGK